MLTEVFTPNTSDQLVELKNIGLKPEWLQEVGMKALAAHNQTTAHDAANASGSYAYFAAVRAIRDILCPEGWNRHVQNNLEMTVNPKNDVSIIISSGNKDTGIKDGSPKTKNPKGNQTKRVVAFNNPKQMQLFPMMEYKKFNSLDRIWILLFHPDIPKSQMRLELSFPIEMDVDELRVSGWNKRIVLPPIDFDHIPSPPKSYHDMSPEFTIELKRKSNG